MPPIETDDLCQEAVLWVANGVDNSGEYKVDAAVEINVRWETSGKEGVDALGNEIIVDSLVVVDQMIPTGSIMWLGELDDLPDTLVDLRRVASYTEVPDIKGQEIRRTVALTRYHDELPALA